MTPSVQNIEGCPALWGCMLEGTQPQCPWKCQLHYSEHRIFSQGDWVWKKRLGKLKWWDRYFYFSDQSPPWPGSHRGLNVPFCLKHPSFIPTGANIPLLENFVVSRIYDQDMLQTYLFKWLSPLLICKVFEGITSHFPLYFPGANSEYSIKNSWIESKYIRQCLFFSSWFLGKMLFS